MMTSAVFAAFLYALTTRSRVSGVLMSTWKMLTRTTTSAPFTLMVLFSGPESILRSSNFATGDLKPEARRSSYSERAWLMSCGGVLWSPPKCALMSRPSWNSSRYFGYALRLRAIGVTVTWSSTGPAPTSAVIGRNVLLFTVFIGSFVSRSLMPANSPLMSSE